MRNPLLKLYIKAQSLLDSLKDESGQDLVEYALVICVLTLALTGGMKLLATEINTAFSGVNAKITAALNVT